jgi:hypothetical protein
MRSHRDPADYRGFVVAQHPRNASRFWNSGACINTGDTV